MIKKTSAILFITLLLLSNCIMISSADTIRDKIVQSSDEAIPFQLVYSSGPAWMQLFTKIEVIDGDVVEVEEFTFKITYRLPVTIFSRFSYCSINTTNFDLEGFKDPEYIKELLQNLKNSTSFTRNKRHSLTFENFTGAFLLRPSRIFRLLPPKFFIPTKLIVAGVCERIVEN